MVKRGGQGSILGHVLLECGCVEVYEGVCLRNAIYHQSVEWFDVCTLLE